METKPPSVISLVTCRPTIFARTFLPHLSSSTPVYIAEVPLSLDVCAVPFIMLERSDVAGMLPFEVDEYIRDIKEITLIPFEQNLPAPVVVGEEDLLTLLAHEFEKSWPYPVKYSLVNRQSGKKKNVLMKHCFFSLEEGAPYCYDFETQRMLN